MRSDRGLGTIAPLQAMALPIPSGIVVSGGPHASHIVIDAAKCVCTPEELIDESATFFNLIAIAMQGVVRLASNWAKPPS